MFSHPAYAQRPQRRGYRELEALADDLEYSASLARQAACPPSRRRPAYAYAPVSESWNSMRERYHEPIAYRRPQSQHYYEPEREVEVQPYLYEPDSEYDEYDAYEYPTEHRAARSPPLYARGDGYVGPRPARIRRIASHSHYAPSHPRYDAAEGPIAYAPKMEPRYVCECRCHSRVHGVPERAWSERAPVRSRESGLVEPELRPHHVTLEDLVHSITGRGQVARPNPNRVRRILPAAVSAAPPRRDWEQTSEALAKHLTPRRHGAEHSRQLAAHAGPDLEALLHQFLEGGAQTTTQQTPHDEPEAPTYSLEDFLGQIAGIVAARPQQPSQQDEEPTAPTQEEAGAPSGSAARVRFAPQAHAEPEPGAVAAKSSEAQPMATLKSSPSSSKTSYTYAAPASAQRGAIPKTVNASATPVLPVPGRLFRHGGSARDGGAQAKPGAADEVAEIREAIRRSLDRREDVKPVPAAPAPGGSSSVAMPASPRAREPSPAPSANSTSTAMSAIDRVEERFVNLKYEFKFPSSPDFPDPSTLPLSSLAAAPALPHTHANRSIHAQENALTGLLTELDAVESGGDSEVRDARKELVKRVERELGKLETLKNDAWQQVLSSIPAAHEDLAESEETTETQATPVLVTDTETAPRAVVAKIIGEVEKADAVGGEGLTTPDEHGEGSVETAPYTGDEEEPTHHATADGDSNLEAHDTRGAEAEEPNGTFDSDLQPLKSAASDVQEAIAAETESRTGLHVPRRASESITSAYPPLFSSSYPPTRTAARRSSSPPPKTENLPASQSARKEADVDSLGSSPVEIPSELASDCGDENSAEAQELEQGGDNVPPSMEESAVLEEKTEFVLL